MHQNAFKLVPDRLKQIDAILKWLHVEFLPNLRNVLLALASAATAFAALSPEAKKLLSHLFM